jgi:hypothetical protein
MQATVKLNDDGERYRIEVGEDGGMSATFNLDSGTAELTKITPNDGDACVYGEQVSRTMDYVSGLDYVETVEILEGGEA